MTHDYRKGHIPYYVDGKRVSRTEYVAHQRGEKKAAAHAELDDIEAETKTADPVPKSTPARKATSKE